ncbi:apolipoprotein N-acyltransferase [Asticcacaulis solisilvae]|uniref:apolipoprotein N-acyltransferase n=1 Tax=Asticcacaulis solisilvae TaxID=1217274 RepID=UPI003FD76F3F
MIEPVLAILRTPGAVKARGLLSALHKRPRILALAAGILIGLAQPPFGFIPGLFGYAILLFCLEQDLGKRPWRDTFFVGWLAGFAYFFVGCFWIAEAFLVDAKTYGWMAPFAATLLPSGIGLFWGLFAMAYRRLRSGKASRFILFAVLFSLLEITRGTILSGFPWDPSGSTWRAGSAMSQMAAFVGVYGLGLITVLIFASPAVIRPREGLRGVWPVAVAAVLWAGGIAIGEVRLATTHFGSTGYTVRVVQPNVGQKAKWTVGALDSLLADYVSLSRAPPAPGRARPALIVWPEGALPSMFEDVMSADSWTAPILTSFLDDKQAFIMGTSRTEHDAKGVAIYRNSMVAMHQDGQQTVIDGFYDKYKLVPFGEFTPFQDILNPLGMKALTHFDDSFTPGGRTKPVQFYTIPKFLPLICYEGIFPSLDMDSYSSSDDPRRPSWILNISNDAWFGPTTGPRQHLNLASYRAIEEGLPMVRSTPTGISVLIDPLGRVVAGSRIDLNQKGFVDLTIPSRVGRTVYSTSRFGIVAFDVIFLLILVPFDPLVLMIRKKPIRSLFRRGRVD